MLKQKKLLRTERQIDLLLSDAGYAAPTRLQKTLIPLMQKGKDLIIEPSDDGERIFSVLAGLILRFSRRDARRESGETPGSPLAVMITDSFSAAETMKKHFTRLTQHLDEKPGFLTVGKPNGEKEESVRLRESADILAGPAGRLIDHLRRGNVNLYDTVSVVISAAGGPDWTGLATDVQFILSKVNRSRQTVLLTNAIGEIPSEINGILKAPFIVTRKEGKQSETKREAVRNDGPRNRAGSIVTGGGSVPRKAKQEKRNVKTKETEIQTDAGSLKHVIDSILESIRHEDNPEELNRLRTAIRRNVPFFMRGYFMAWIMREQYLKKSAPKARKGGTTSLFVGIGKNRKAFPRDILQLFQTTAGIARADLGEIKVLDNYSFVDISVSQAQKAIDALNGMQYRGRRINVNYAKKKDGDADAGDVS